MVTWSRAAASGEGFGPRVNVRLWTWTVVTRCAPGAEPVCFPLDEELELLPGELSATLAEGVARLGTKMPFAQAVAEVAFFWGIELEETTVRRHTQAAGAAYVAEQTAELERLEREPPSAQPGPAVQYLSADGAMVPLVRGEWAEVKTLAIGEVAVRPGSDGLPEAQTTQLTYFSRLRMRRRSPASGRPRWPRGWMSKRIRSNTPWMVLGRCSRRSVSCPSTMLQIPSPRLKRAITPWRTSPNG